MKMSKHKRGNETGLFRLRGQGPPPQSLFMLDIISSPLPSGQMHLAPGVPARFQRLQNAQPQKGLLRSMGFGAKHQQISSGKMDSQTNCWRVCIANQKRKFISASPNSRLLILLVHQTGTLYTTPEF